MNDVNTQAQMPAYGDVRDVFVPQKNTVTKIAVVIVVLLLIFFAFAFFGGDTPDKVKVVPATGASQTEGEVPAVGTIPEAPKSDAPVVPVSKCPQGEVMNEEKGECESLDKTPDAVGPIGEVKSVKEEMKDYTKYLWPYTIWQTTQNYILQDKINGYPLRYRILFFTPYNKLIVSIGYLDDNNEWVEDKLFTSTTRDVSVNKWYCGKFTKDDPNYKHNGSPCFGVYEDQNPPRLRSSTNIESINGVGARFYSSLEDEPVILDD